MTEDERARPGMLGGGQAKLEAAQRAAVFLQDAREAVMRGFVHQSLLAIDEKRRAIEVARAEVDRLQTEIRVHQADLRFMANGDLDLIRQAQQTDSVYRAVSLVPVDQLPMVPRRFAEAERLRTGVFPTSASPMRYEVAGTTWEFRLPAVVDYGFWLRALSGLYPTASRPEGSGSALIWIAADHAYVTPQPADYRVRETRELRASREAWGARR